MKKILALFTLGIFILHSNINAQITKDDLINDSRVVEYGHKNLDLSLEILNSFSSTERSNMNLIIEQRKQENLSFEEQFVVINDLFKFNDNEKFKLFFEMYSNYKPYLETTYGIIPSDILESAYSDIISIQPRAIDCGWKYNLCCAGAFSAAAIMFAGCEGVSVGIGTPLCLAGAIVWQTSAISDCAETYCK